MKNKRIQNRISLSAVMTAVVVGLVLIILTAILIFFVRLYENSVEQSSVVNSEQSARQVVNTVENYTEDMADTMALIMEYISQPTDVREDFFDSFFEIRTDAVAVTIYDEDGVLLGCWSGEQQVKENILQNLSYAQISEAERLHISKPHVESLLEEYYPWVVTISQKMQDDNGEELQVFMDISFSRIAAYVDEVSVGQRGYCFIQDTDGDLVYHPQQQLIYAGLKAEEEELHDLADGSYIRSNIIYTVSSLSTCNWRVVAVSYVDELITERVERMFRICLIVLFLMFVTAVLVGSLFSRLFAKPAKKLTSAMEAFEQNAENFCFEPVQGTSEIAALSSSFGHMVLRIQHLMEKVRQEEISLRKTELKALQTQINPHFLYNTLDSIAWMCEENRTKEAEEMINTLARLFRISISKGHELIPLEKEIEHAESYLKIQNYRYKNQFTYNFDVEKAALSYYCNKITLQPIIENAIYHGIDMMVDTGHIEIRVWEESDAIVMTVEDNGIGMTQEQCEKILQSESGEKKGIGIKNVNDRIQIYFGKEYGLEISSEPDVGTCVRIRIPKLGEVIV